MFDCSMRMSAAQPNGNFAIKMFSGRKEICCFCLLHLMGFVINTGPSNFLKCHTGREFFFLFLTQKIRKLKIPNSIQCKIQNEALFGSDFIRNNSGEIPVRWVGSTRQKLFCRNMLLEKNMLTQVEVEHVEQAEEF